jgi:hypothetical protein
MKTENLKVEELLLNDHKVLVVDAPVNATHSEIAIHDGAHYNICRKNKTMDIHCFDQSKSDGELYEKYNSILVNVGCLNTAEEGLVADLFNPVKRGNFYDYEHNGVFYPSAVSALKDIIGQTCNYINPYVLIIKPFKDFYV